MAAQLATAGDVAALYKLMERRATAAALNRCSRAAELAAEAAVLALRLYGTTSLAVIKMRLDEAAQWSNQSHFDGGRDATFLASAWAALQLALPPLQTRLDADAGLLQPTLRPEEVRFFTHNQKCSRAAQGHQPLDDEMQALLAQFGGYTSACEAVDVGICLLEGRLGTEAERRLAQDVSLKVLDLVGKTGMLQGQAIRLGAELSLVSAVAHKLKPGKQEAQFLREFLRKWNSPAVSGELHGRGSLRDGVAVTDAGCAQFEARRLADVAAKGRRACALPSCGRTEVSVKEFKVCGGCRAVAYCSAEHQALHWAGGHKKSCATMGRGAPAG